MSEPFNNATLSSAERQLIEGLRALTDPAVRERAPGILAAMLFYLQNPRCQGMGVEGFPCGEPASTCEECEQIWSLLDRISQRS
jgi:hypothetical protein